MKLEIELDDFDLSDIDGWREVLPCNISREFFVELAISYFLCDLYTDRLPKREVYAMVYDYIKVKRLLKRLTKDDSKNTPWSLG